ncbi:hypothetical protein FA13DRAFT_1724535 [Coprinellus micaceus]|uniref:DUF6533 domain-containing protein n=1 Tax=Coprinellus micaceus TaxID=71717 RepID=A0A4Y7TWR2_COPMI|nr:hypothetical protein FA13DRAFT_1724535 [Coprinellus micaceus]
MASPQMLEAIKANMIVNYASIGCSALYIADYLHTLPDEVRYMWPSSFSLVKTLFFVVRYYPFAHTSISIWHHTRFDLTREECMIPFAIDSYSCLALTVFCDAITHLRIYAFSGQNVYLLAFLVVYFITVRVIEFYFLTQFIKSAIFGDFPKGSRIGCLAIKGNSSLLSSVFITVLIGVSILTILMLALAWRRRDNIGSARGSLATVFARDGVYYFLVLSSLAAANIIVDYAAPQNGTQFILVQAQIHLNAIITTRMLMALRKWANKDRNLTLGSSGIPHTNGPTDGVIEFKHYDSKAVPTVYVEVTKHTNTSSSGATSIPPPHHSP